MAVGIVGAALQVGGAGMQFAAQHQRERAMNRAMGAITRRQREHGETERREGTRVEAALDALAASHGQTLQEFYDERLSTRRPLAEQAQAEVMRTASQTGLAGAQEILAPPPSARAPADPAFDRSLATAMDYYAPNFQTQEAVLTDQGAQAGRMGFDEALRRGMQFDLAGLDHNRMGLEVLAGLGVADRANIFDEDMAAGQRRLERAQRAGGGLGVAGAVMQTVGGAMTGTGAMQPARE